MTDFTSFYAALAVLVPVWSFMPLYEPAKSSGYQGSLWDMAAGEYANSALGGLGLITVAAATILMVVAARGTVRVAIPAITAVLGALMVLGIMTTSGYDGRPALADSGKAAVALLAVMIAIAVWHIGALVRTGRTARAEAV